ncbi:MAG: DUF3380 domain-containing protein [Saprospiraceae bacterium]|nr:DUF3380 domain-containing protein [Saprospiraceae bacterium]
MLAAVEHPDIQNILTLPSDADAGWKRDLERLRNGDVTLSRKTAGENSIKAVQRLLIFLGYSTSSSGAFAIDGDFGRGTNRAVAQFQFENGLTSTVTRKHLTYPCTWQTARKEITVIPDVLLDVPTMEIMLAKTLSAIEKGEVNCGSLEAALFHLNGLQRNRFSTCAQLLEQYGEPVQKATARLKAERGADVRPEWMLSIIKQETGGVVRPRFEQHLLTRMNATTPNADLAELRYRSMSFGLGQILGINYKTVGAASARAMFTSPIEEQVLFVGRFLAANKYMRAVVGKSQPASADFHTIGKYYNGPGYAAHHYHESLERWFKEFRGLMK